MRRALLVAATMLWAGAASADDAAGSLPSVSEVVEKARAVMDKKPERVVCQVRIDTQLLDKTGKLEHQEQRDATASFNGDKQDLDSTRVVRDGKALTADELAAERAKNKKSSEKRKKDDEEFDLAPLTSKNAGKQEFELLRKETLWGRPAYVLKVKAQKSESTLANGTVWIDAERFVELKGELVPSEMPPHADWVKIQEQFVIGPRQVPVPAFLHIEGAGHMMFMHKQFRTTLHWSDCR
jgi:hypothetical protein